MQPAAAERRVAAQLGAAAQRSLSRQTASPPHTHTHTCASCAAGHVSLHVRWAFCAPKYFKNTQAQAHSHTRAHTHSRTNGQTDSLPQATARPACRKARSHAHSHTHTHTCKISRIQRATFACSPTQSQAQQVVVVFVVHFVFALLSSLGSLHGCPCSWRCQTVGVAKFN